MKLNRTITHQTLKELSKSIAKMADMLDPAKAHGIECKKITVEKQNDEFDVYQVDINIRLSLIDGELKEMADILERFK
jgi:hypothetical protein